jgi:hypothetical protein
MISWNSAPRSILNRGANRRMLTAYRATIAKVASDDEFLHGQVENATRGTTDEIEVMIERDDFAELDLDHRGIMAAGGVIELFTPKTKGKDMPAVRIRLGESVAETMAEIGERGAQNDHALRDQVVKIPWLGKTTIGPSGMRFLDWPTYENKTAVHEGLQAMMTLTMESGARLCEILGDKEAAQLCSDTAKLLRTHQPEASGRKSPAALLSLAGLRDPADVATVLKKDGPKDLSTFYGFYVLNALAKSGDIETGLDFISRYWGVMKNRPTAPSNPPSNCPMVCSRWPQRQQRSPDLRKDQNSRDRHRMICRDL